MVGKVSYYHMVLQSLPIYTLSAMNPPKSMLKLIEKNLANFFLGTNVEHKKYHWSSWENLCIPIDEGGISIRKMEDICNTFSTKRWWRLRSTASLWTTFVKHKYCIRSHMVTKVWASGNSHA